MAVLTIPDKGESINDFKQIQDYLHQRGITFEHWKTSIDLSQVNDQEQILKAYSSDVQRIMQAGGYQSADVIAVNEQTPGIEEIRKKFLSEHTHSEDEIRFFVDGQGLFWFNLENGPVISLLCQKGELLSVPAGTKHWFDLGKNPFVKAIRIFTSKEGWVANYTHSNIDVNYNLKSGF